MKKNHGRYIGFFGGSFDPIHFGHLHLALEMLEKHHLDQVVFCPAYKSPLKINAPPQASAEQRRKMVELAISEIPQFQLLTWELERITPSYTIDAIKYLIDKNKAEGQEITFKLIMGEDILNFLKEWREVEALLSLASPLIGTRLCEEKNLIHPAFLLPYLQEGLTKIPVMEICSTTLRERLHSKKYCGHLVPGKVLDYIHQNRLY